MKKLKSKRGETISEALVTVLIVALASALLVMMTTASIRIQTSAEEQFDSLYDELTIAETGAGTLQGSVTLNETEATGAYKGRIANYQTWISGDADALQSYRKAVTP